MRTLATPATHAGPPDTRALVLLRDGAPSLGQEAPLALAARDLTKRFSDGTAALRGVDLAVRPGELVGVLGSSGAGKTTLLRLLAGVLRPTRGDLAVLGQPMRQLSAARLRQLRRRLAYIAQNHSVVPALSVAHNVLLGHLGSVSTPRALLSLLRPRAADRVQVFQALQAVEMADKMYVRAEDLSGGQQQRVAVARALLGRPELLLADEPVASVDQRTAGVVLELFARLHAERGTTVVMSLHQVDFAVRYCRRLIVLDDGRLVYDGPAGDLDLDTLYAQPSTDGIARSD